MQILDPISNPKVLSLLLTLQCTAQCLHCGTMSSPRAKGKLPLEIAQRLIHEAKVLDFDSVVFTGGEPTLYGEGLFELISLASEFDLPTRIVTNAHWALSSERADQMMRRLHSAGLLEINFSTGDEHAHFVSIENIVRAMRAALDVGIKVAVMVEIVEDRKISKDTILAHPLFLKLIPSEEASSISIVESPWMPLDENQISKYPSGLAVNSGNISQRLGCDSVINTTTVLGNGKIMACCGLGTRSIPELEVGNVYEDTIFEIRNRVENDFLKRWIRNEGPERILQWAAQKNPTIVWEDQYAHRCQACKRIYTDPLVRDEIEQHYEEKILDVLFSEFYLHEFEQSEADVIDEPAPSI